MENAGQEETNGRMSLWEAWETVLQGKTENTDTPFTSGVKEIVNTWILPWNEEVHDRGGENFLMTAMSVPRKPRPETPEA